MWLEMVWGSETKKKLWGFLGAQQAASISWKALRGSSHHGMKNVYIWQAKTGQICSLNAARRMSVPSLQNE
jgi:hypothetical protein